MSDNRANVYMEGDTAVYRASSLGRCQKALTAARLGMPQSPVPGWLQTIFDHGNRGEDTIINLLPQYGWQFDGGGQDEVTVNVSPTAIIRGHIDGLGTPWITEKPNTPRSLSDEQFCLEMKTMSAKVFEEQFKRTKLQNFPAYRWQGSIYGAALSLPVMFVIGVKKKDSSGDVDFLHFHRMTPEEYVPIAKIKARVLTTEALAQAGVPPDTCDVPADGWCPMEYLHDGAEDAALDAGQPAPDDDTSSQIAALAADYQAAKDLESRYKAAKDEARDLLDELMGDQKKVMVDGFTVLRSVSYRKSFNTKRLKEELPIEVWQRFEEESDEPTVTLKVSVAK